jgi:o-succinylbenzoate---CoA ligase
MPSVDRLVHWLRVNGYGHLVPELQERWPRLDPRHPQVIATADPERFLVEFWAAVLATSPVILTDPHWGTAERQQFARLVATYPPPGAGQILIPTGGTSGQLKFAIHRPNTLKAAVEGFQKFYGVEAINSYCLLPWHHVSGLMQLWRSILTTGQLVVARSPQPVTAGEFFLALVPTQLQRWLDSDGDWLRSFRAVIIGGAPLPLELAAAARARRIPLSPSYGATETAAMVTALPPEDFLAGQLSSGRPLPHVHLTLGDRGTIDLRSPALMVGYWPPMGGIPPWEDDVGELDDRGCLHIRGRHSQKIISGGENIFPNEIEAAIWATGLVADVAVLGQPDREWGERVVACYVPRGDVPELQLEAQLGASLREQLAPWKQPKRWWRMAVLPRNDRGKLDQRQLAAEIENLS